VGGGGGLKRRELGGFLWVFLGGDFFLGGGGFFLGIFFHLSNQITFSRKKMGD